MAMEISLTRAIAKAKRNIESDKYSRMENLLDAIYQYRIREDEVEVLVNSVNKWLEKGTNYLYAKKYTEAEVERLLRNM